MAGVVCGLQSYRFCFYDCITMLAAVNGRYEDCASSGRYIDMADESYYDAAALAAAPAGELPPELCTLHASLGVPSARVDNLLRLGSVAVYAAGSRVHFLDTQSGDVSYLPSLSGCAVGAIGAHPSGAYLCVAETGCSPLCCVYEYPSLRLYRVLRGGTERAYSACSFDPAGARLATVGSSPDFMLTVWDWKTEKIELRSKAFSQEVYRVTFSPHVDGSLVTSGTGHIRFWRMASTFTGLKLQGAIGKFGTVALSDISGYVELPSGKVQRTAHIVAAPTPPRPRRNLLDCLRLLG